MQKGTVGKRMLRDITLGQYYSVDSVIHQLDPRLKIRMIIAYIVISLLDRNLPLFALLTALFVLTVIVSHVPMSHMLRGTKSILIVVGIGSALNIFTTRGTILVKLGALCITDAGIVKAGFVFWRMLLLIFMSSMLMYTTTPTKLTDGFEKCFHLRGSTAMGITIALRFISVLAEEMQRIMRAQEARGADFHSGGPVTRLKSLRTVAVPLFQNAIDRAGNLADAMDARCYTGGKGRSKLNPLKYKVQDYIGYIGLLIFLLIAAFLIVRF